MSNPGFINRAPWNLTTLGMLTVPLHYCNLVHYVPTGSSLKIEKKCTRSQYDMQIAHEVIFAFCVQMGNFIDFFVTVI